MSRITKQKEDEASIHDSSPREGLGAEYAMNSKFNLKSLVIAWASHSLRVFSMADELGGKASLQYVARLTGPWLTPLRYLVQSWNTWSLLERERPDIVIVQNPPIFAPLVVAMWCRLRGRRSPSRKRAGYVIDAHTASFHHPFWRWTHPFLRLLARRALVTLVTDAAALKMLENWGARGLFLPNGLPTLNPPTGPVGSVGEMRVAVINTFDTIEPMDVLFAAARLLPEVTFYVTGDPRRAAQGLLEQKPENVILTGFLRGGDYTALLKNVHGVAILTTEPNDLSCAAYEALVMEKPVVASDGREMRRFYTHGFIFVKNTPESIAQGVKQMLEDRATLTQEIIVMRSVFESKRQPQFKEFVATLNSV